MWHANVSSLHNMLEWACRYNKAPQESLPSGALKVKTRQRQGKDKNKDIGKERQGTARQGKVRQGMV